MTTERISKHPIRCLKERIWAKWRGYPIIPLLIVALLLICAIFAERIAQYSPIELALTDRLMPPFWQTGGSLGHPLGTDALGRDILTRMIFGVRISFSIAALSILLSALIGIGVGIMSGYFGGLVDVTLMRITDVFIAFPAILLALLLSIVFGPSFSNLVFAIALTLWPRYARLMRGEVLSIRERDFIAAARICGCSPVRIMIRHIFPNLLNTVLVMLTLQVGWVIITEASLSFLGAGIPPPTPTWGGMVSEGRQYVVSAWWIAIIPGIAILLSVLSFNLLGDWARDVLDPKLRQV